MKSLRIGLLCVLASASRPAVPAHAGPASSGGASTSPQSSSTTPAVKKKTKKKHSKRQPTQQAPTPERISEIQSALARGGYYEGDPNGKWDANTVDAVQKFQASHGIEASGKLDAPTLQKLGLGSAIAGVSAPKPVTPQAPASQTPSAALPSGAASGAGGGSPNGATTPAASGSQLVR
jgi:peptidoglycan hydrolase-like protein with peptidoglycan-binding domain